MQLRIGDKYIGTQVRDVPHGLDRLHDYVACARTLRPAAKILFMSDVAALKDEARKRYGDALITHTSHAHAPTLYHMYSHSALKGIAAELQLARRCDAFVISRDSGIGLQATFLARNVSAANVRRMPGCKKPALEELARSWSKI